MLLAQVSTLQVRAFNGLVSSGVGAEWMELINLLTGQPAAVALAILAVYWLNRNTLEFAREKREIIELIRAERKEWLDQAREDRRELIEIQRSCTEADHQVAERMAALESRVDRELHALRNTLTPLVAPLQRLLARFDIDTPRGVGGGDRDGTD